MKYAEGTGKTRRKSKSDLSKGAFGRPKHTRRKK